MVLPRRRTGDEPVFAATAVSRPKSSSRRASCRPQPKRRCRGAASAPRSPAGPARTALGSLAPVFRPGSAPARREPEAALVSVVGHLGYELEDGARDGSGAWVQLARRHWRQRDGAMLQCGIDRTVGNPSFPGQPLMQTSTVPSTAVSSHSAASLPLPRTGPSQERRVGTPSPGLRGGAGTARPRCQRIVMP